MLVLKIALGIILAPILLVALIGGLASGGKFLVAAGLFVAALLVWQTIITWSNRPDTD